MPSGFLGKSFRDLTHTEVDSESHMPFDPISFTPASFNSRPYCKQPRSLRRAIGVALVTSAFGLALPASAAGSLLWPSEGSFPAYPSEVDESAFHAAASAAYGIDDNLFRVGDDAPPPIAGVDERGDRYLRVSVGVDAHLESGRQGLTLAVRGDHYSFDNFSLLDEFLYSGEIDWDWALGPVTGDLGYRYSRDYPNFSELQFASEDLVTKQVGHFALGWQLLSRMALRLLAESSKYQHSDEALQLLDNKVNAGTAGLFYVSPNGGSIGAQHKVSEGKYPNRQPVGLTVIDNEYRENESSVAAAKPLATQEGGKVGFDVRVGYTQRRHEEVVERDFDGATGRARLRYSPLPKILLDVSAYRELQAVEDLLASYAVVTGGSASIAWAPTYKWVIQAGYSHNDRSLEGNPGFILTDTPPREDKIKSARASLGYEPNRYVALAVSYERGTRTSNTSGADYEFSLALAQITLKL